jgi:hypothetical protein
MSDNKWSKPATPPPPLFAGKKEKDLVKQVNDEVVDRIEKISVFFHKRRLTEDQNLFVREGDFILYGDNYYEILTLEEPKWLYGQVETRFEIAAKCVKARRGLFDGT